MKQQKKTTKRLTMDLSTDERNALVEFCKEKTMSIADVLRKGGKLVIALNKGEVFLSADPNCSNKIPHSIL